MTTAPRGLPDGCQVLYSMRRPRTPTNSPSSPSERKLLAVTITFQLSTPNRCAAAVLTHSHARIEDRVHGVDDDVRGHHKEGSDQHDPNHDRKVLHLDCLHHRKPEPGQSEDALGDDGAAEHGGKIDAELRDD